MKKIIALNILLLGVVFLAGCGQQTSQTQKDDNISNQQIDSKKEQQKISEYKDWEVYSSQNIGIKFMYPNFLKNPQENISDSGITVDFNFDLRATEKNSFFAKPVLRVSIINNKNINNSDYQTQADWQKITKTWKIDGQNAIFIENREAGPFDMVVIENPSKQNSVIEFYAQNGLVNGKDYVVDLNKTVESIEFIK